MEDSKRWAIQLNYKDLLKDLHTDDIQEHMIACGIMDEDDFEKITNSGELGIPNFISAFYFIIIPVSRKIVPYLILNMYAKKKCFFSIVVLRMI